METFPAGGCTLIGRPVHRGTARHPSSASVLAAVHEYPVTKEQGVELICVQKGIQKFLRCKQNRPTRVAVSTLRAYSGDVFSKWVSRLPHVSSFQGAGRCLCVASLSLFDAQLVAPQHDHLGWFPARPPGLIPGA